MTLDEWRPMTPDERAWVIHKAKHELGHACVARAVGWAPLLVSIAPTPGWEGVTLLAPRPAGLSDLDESAQTQAGDIAARIVRTPALTWKNGDPERATRAALASLAAPDDLDFVEDALRGGRSAPNAGSGDEERAEAHAREVAGDDWERFLRAARARAWKLVVDTAPLIEALIPVQIRRLVMSGPELEAVIQALAEPRPPCSKGARDAIRDHPSAPHRR